MGIGMIVAVERIRLKRLLSALRTQAKKLILSVNLLTAKRCGDSR